METAMKLAMALLTSSRFKRNSSLCPSLPLSTSQSLTVSPYACELSVQVKWESLERKLKYNKAGDCGAERQKTNVQTEVAAAAEDDDHCGSFEGWWTLQT